MTQEKVSSIIEKSALSIKLNRLNQNEFEERFNLFFLKVEDEDKINIKPIYSILSQEFQKVLSFIYKEPEDFYTLYFKRYWTILFVRYALYLFLKHEGYTLAMIAELSYPNIKRDHSTLTSNFKTINESLLKYKDYNFMIILKIFIDNNMYFNKETNNLINSVFEYKTQDEIKLEKNNFKKILHKDLYSKKIAQLLIENRQKNE